jgi:eukaryotic-like serine/threonine-protein kinase
MPPKPCYCINPVCRDPGNQGNNNSQQNYCNQCGSPLLLNSKYRASRLLSNNSGFGLVFEVFQGYDAKILKVLRPEFNQNSTVIDLFQREYQVLHELTQKGITGVPKAEDFFIYNHTLMGGYHLTLYCLVMEKVEGDDLEKWVNYHGKISQKQAVKWLKEVVLILHEIHKLDWFHRDLKPPNIMMRHGQLVLIDFGTARAETNTYQANLQNRQITGIESPGYTPNEQKNGQAVKQSDFFALGRTFVHLLTGKHPLTMYDGMKDQLIWRGETDNIHSLLLDFIDDLMSSSAINRPPDTNTILQRLVKIERSITNPPPPPLPSPPLPRRDFLQLLYWFGGGSIATFILASLIPKNQNTNDSRKSPTKNPTNNPSDNPTKNPSDDKSSNIGKKGTFDFQTITVDSYGKQINLENLTAENWTFDLGNGVTLEMVKIPAGSFVMGSPNSENKRENDEGPQHTVNLQEFYMGRYPVTQEQYQQIMGKNPSSFQKGGKYPVEQVSWNDCQDFLSRLSQKIGVKFVLPSESQWEYACRAGTNTPFHFGEAITTDLANYNGSSEYRYANEPTGVYLEQTTAVDKYPYPNAFGLSDMHGNVWEWCEDYYHDNYNGAPTDGSARNDINAKLNNYMVIRGGSWDLNPQYCRSAYRVRHSRDSRNWYRGFRLVFSPFRT